MKFSFLLILVLCFSLVSSVSVCIDRTDPSAPAGLGVSGDASSRVLVWDEVIDEPSCSGIDYYNVSRDGSWIGRVDGDVLSFVDNESLSRGGYGYTVYAVDLVGHNSGPAIKNVIKIGGGSGGGVSGGSSSSSYVCVEDWECGAWTECVGNEQGRLCNDLNECGTVDDEPETYQECGLMSEADIILESSDEEADVVGGIEGFFSTITGAVVGSLGTGGTIVVSVFILVMVGSFVFVRIRKSKGK